MTAVGGEFVDRFAGSLKQFAVDTFGTNDKPALVTGIVITSIVLGAVLGMASSAAGGSSCRSASWRSGWSACGR